MPKGFTIPAKQVKAVKGYPVADMGDVQSLQKIGIDVLAMDSAIVPNMTTASVGTPLQFLQTWLSGFVEVVTKVRNIDEIVGINTIGSWEDEEIVQGISERSGKARLYSDHNNIPLSNANVSYEKAAIVRFEHGIEVGRLEEARAGKSRYNLAESMRKGAALALEISRNEIGFNGFNNGSGGTYGLLNANGLPAYTTVATGAGGTTAWSTKTALEIIKDIQVAMAKLRTQAGGLVDPQKDDVTLVLPTNVVDYLGTVTQYGYSVNDWLGKNYPKCRVVSCPEFENANGGQSVMYVFADKYAEDSTDDGYTFAQLVPAKFMTLGVEQGAKSYKEDYTNATAGVICKRPFLVVRYTAL